MEPVLLYITASNREEAISIAYELLGARLIACANIVDGAFSLYHWEGEIERKAEALIIAKTLQSKIEAVTARVKKASSYDCPCVVALPIVGGNPEYIDWLKAQVDAID
jgi:periplasmic divalent cation tolerance protein